MDFMSQQGGPRKSWWQTLPGVLTATAGVITAVTGLIVALNQVGLLGEAGDASSPAGDGPAIPEVQTVPETDADRSRPSLDTPSSQAAPAAQPEINLSGQWQGTDGLTYNMRQNGNEIDFVGFHPIDGRAAEGQGMIVGEEIHLSYRTIYGAAGDGTLEISSDGRRLVGQVRDHLTGSVLSIMLIR